MTNDCMAILHFNFPYLWQYVLQSIIVQLIVMTG